MFTVVRLLRAALVGLAASAITLAQLNLPSAGFWHGKVRSYERDIRALLSATLLSYVDEYKAPWDQVGVHAFLLKRSMFRRFLVNIGGIRLGSKPSMDSPPWRPGKGVVGLAFENRCPILEDWEQFFSQAMAEGPQFWERRSQRQRYSLSWGELQHTGGYHRILAYPIFSMKGKLIGCVSVDGPLSEDRLLESKSLNILRSLAASVALLGFPPVAWWGYNR
jgi:hypothetical protein